MVNACQGDGQHQPLKGSHVNSADLAALHEVHQGSDPGGDRTQTGPVVRRQDHNRQFAICEVLLVADVLIAGYQDLKPRMFGGIKKRSIFETLPAQLAGPDNLMSPKRSGQRSRSIGIEQDLHATAAG
jgi:hypothetical protein